MNSIESLKWFWGDVLYATKFMRDRAARETAVDLWFNACELQLQLHFMDLCKAKLNDPATPR
jgi:hypothetical protein